MTTANNVSKISYQNEMTVQDLRIKFQPVKNNLQQFNL